MPITGTALLIALSVVPGYFYLQLTAGYRRPETKTTLSEVLEVLLVGLATTGLSVAVLTMVFTDSAREVLLALLATPADLHVGQLRGLIITGVIVIAVSLSLASLLSLLTRHRASRRFSPSVSQATLGVDKRGHIRVVSMGMANGSTIDGVLHAYTLGDDEDSRAIAVKEPIRHVSMKGEATALTYNYLVLFGPDIKHIAVSHVVDPGAPLVDVQTGPVARIQAAITCARRCWAESRSSQDRRRSE